MTQGPSAHGLDPQASQIRGSTPRMTGEVDGSGEWAEAGARGEADAAMHRAAWAPCCSARLTSDWIGYSGPRSDSFRHLDGAQRRWPAPITAAASWPVPG